ncbi:MAG: PD40 domain-containing protein [Anaerolineae bacterium]|nr:PD40 domain-containing protein [Anaerolineae bacterium]
MSHIFISYAHKERAVVEALYKPLARVYQNVWFDRELTGGDVWWERIVKQIQDSDIFLIVLSDLWIRSDWSKREYDEAVLLGKKLLPIRIEDIKLPQFLDKLQYVDVLNGELNANNLPELYASINRISDEISDGRLREQQRLREEQEQQIREQAALRGRTNRLRAVAILAIFALAGVGIILGLTQSPQFQGTIAYISRPRDGVNQEVRLLEGGLSGLVRNILQRGPIRFSNVKASPNSKIAMSPDGKRIAFASQIQDNQNQGINLNIYIFTIADNSVKQLTVNKGDNVNPTWSPDGTQIAFASNRDGNWEIYRMNVDGTGLVNLTNKADSDDNFPAWSPRDGSYIAFVTNRDGNLEIYRMNTEGGNLKNLTHDSHDDDMPAWSPDGKQIAFESNRLSQDSTPLGDDLGTSAVNPCTTANHDIGITDFDGNSIAWPVQSLNSDDRSPAWSPDGQHIVFSSNRRNGNDLYITPINTGFNEDAAVLLTQDQLEDDSYPVWQA